MHRLSFGILVRPETRSRWYSAPPIKFCRCRIYRTIVAFYSKIMFHLSLWWSLSFLLILIVLPWLLLGCYLISSSSIFYCAWFLICICDLVQLAFYNAHVYVAVIVSLAFAGFLQSTETGNRSSIHSVLKNRDRWGVVWRYLFPFFFFNKEGICNLFLRHRAICG